MERVRQEVVKTKVECGNTLDEERKTLGKEMEKVRNELENAKKQVASLTKIKRMSKGDMQEELVALQQQHQVNIMLLNNMRRLY